MFEYLIDKVRRAEFQAVPFKHLHIKDFLSDEHFAEIVSSDEINIPPQQGDEGLFAALFARGYRIISFPGCITDKAEYLGWHQDKSSLNGRNNSACEGFGMTLRLAEPKTGIIVQLKSFLEGEAFNRALAEKFGIPLEETNGDCGIQKYLDGYEISPHPDIRRKALTYMVNINPHPDSERLEHHTHYLTLKPQYNYVKEFWAGNPNLDTFWIPWSWCDTVSEQRDNNSVVIFSPTNDTIHAVKAAYDHRKGQRTQLYGNLWYKERHRGLRQLHWSDFDVLNAQRPMSDDRPVQDRPVQDRPSLLSKVKSVVPGPIKDRLRPIKDRLGRKPVAANDPAVLERDF
jgi:hypothetical protein